MALSSSHPKNNSMTTSLPSTTTTQPLHNNNNANDDEEQEHLLMTPLMVTLETEPRLRRTRSLQDEDDDAQQSILPLKKRNGPLAALKNTVRFIFRKCPTPTDSCYQSMSQLMNILAKLTFWFSLVGMVLCVVWYSYELKNNGTDPHLIAWFSAGAFVLLGFPISMYGIVMHLANYNQAQIQCYIVRILWMVPIYSLESWLCLRFHEFAIYIETLRDCYEAYVLYNFLQFLIEVLGGQEALILLLKDKSPTRGVHMWGLQWCVKPWLMGQPKTNKSGTVEWTSPFFVKCKFGVLQYVLLKAVSSVFVMILELHGLYKEGDFGFTSGYLYICILTNTSQCWALYCLIFFYYATKNELSPIRPVGKFLSVKALVFFTWWQSVGISMLYQAGMIPHYNNEWTSEDVAKGLQDYLICIEMFVGAIVHIFVFPHSDYSAEAVAARNALMKKPQFKKRLGRKHYRNNGDDVSKCSNMSGGGDLETAAPCDATTTTAQDELHATTTKTTFVSALLQSTIPTDVMDNTVGIVKGDYHVEKKTLLHHAATHDQYDLFSRSILKPHHHASKDDDQVVAVRKLSADKSEKEQQ